MSAALQQAQDPNLISIMVGNYTLSGWEQARITRSLETFPSSFEISTTERYPTQPAQIVINPGDPIQVMLGEDTVITGYVDDYSADITPDEHTVRITGRSKCADLTDCSAGESPFQLNNQTLGMLARSIAKPFGITVSNPDGDSAPVPVINITLTSTPFEVLEPFAAYANFILHDDTAGNLVIARVGDASAGSGFVQGQNVESAAISYSMHSRYTDIKAIFISTGFLNDGLPPDAGSGAPVIPAVPGGQALDKSFPKRADGQPRFRPLYVVSEQSQNTQELAAQRAQWDMARRIGRSQAVRLTCDSWRDSKGKLWEINTLAPVSLPALKLSKANLLIASVTFLRDENGTHADVVLMPKAAFVPEPVNLLPFDNQVAQALPNGSSNVGPTAR